MSHEVASSGSGLPAFPAVITAKGSVALVRDCVTGLADWGTATERVTFATVAVNGALSGNVAKVHVITGGTAFTLTTPTACEPNSLSVKNTSALAISLTGVTGTIDGAASYTLPAAGGIGSGGAGQPTLNLAFDGTNWFVL